MKLVAGATVGDYTLGAQLGAGACGVVFQARHRGTGGEVALKALLPGATPDDLERFRREGEAMARLRHPNLLQVHGLVEHEGWPVLVMELARASLEARLRKGPLPWARAVEVTQGLAAGLAAAHEAGILHRDLKPGNVLFGDDGEPKLADFGLARLDDRTRLTQSGAVLGTPAYMAPEQIKGEASAASDLYSLAAILYRCAAGREPIDASGGVLQVLSRVMHQEPPRLSRFVRDVPVGLDALAAEALAKTPGARPSLEAFRGRLASLEPTSRLGPLALGAALLAITSLVALALTAGAWTSNGDDDTPAEPEVPLADDAQVDPSSPQAHAVAEVVDASAVLRAAFAEHGPGAFDTRWAGLSAAAAELDGDPWVSCEALKDPNLGLGLRRAHLLRLALAGHASQAFNLLEEPLNADGKALLLCVAELGETRALRRLGRARVERNPDSNELRLRYRYLGYATQLHVTPHAIEKDLRDKGVADLGHPGKVWVELWEQAGAPSAPAGSAWRHAQEALASGDGPKAVARYLQALNEPWPARRRCQLLAELRRAAELSWITPLHTRDSPWVQGLPLPLDRTPLPQLLTQADAVLERTRWARGHYLRAVLRLEQQRGRPGRDLDPVFDDLARALVLAPDFLPAHWTLAAVAAQRFPWVSACMASRDAALANAKRELDAKTNRAVYLQLAQRMLPGLVSAAEVRAALLELAQAPGYTVDHEKRLRELRRTLKLDAGEEESGLQRRIALLLERNPSWNTPELRQAAAPYMEGIRGRAAYSALSDPERAGIEAQGAALALARRGHLRGLLELIRRAPPPTKAVRALLLEIGVLGEPQGFLELGGLLEAELVSAPADSPGRLQAAALRTVGLASELGRSASALEHRLRSRELYGRFPRLEQAWITVWEAQHGDPGELTPSWRAARVSLAAGELDAALEGYLRALANAPSGAAYRRVRRELWHTATQHWTEQASLHAALHDLVVGYRRPAATPLPLAEVLEQADRTLDQAPFANGFALRAVLRWCQAPDAANAEEDLQQAVGLRRDLAFAHRIWNRVSPTTSPARRLDRVQEYLALTAWRGEVEPEVRLEQAWARRLAHDAAPDGNLDARACLESEGHLPDQHAWAPPDQARYEELLRLRASCRAEHLGCRRAYGD